AGEIHAELNRLEAAGLKADLQRLAQLRVVPADKNVLAVVLQNIQQFREARVARLGYLRALDLGVLHYERPISPSTGQAHWLVVLVEKHQFYRGSIIGKRRTIPVGPAAGYESQSEPD